MAKVFISYSRKDIEFARKLTSKLQEDGLDFWIDWEGIPPTVDWRREIEKGIEEADVFLFLISPDSAKSKICAEEIDCAAKNGKRLIPIVVRDIKGEETPEKLSHLNWIFFRESDDFDAAARKLMTAIHADYEWAANHRRLQVKALEWERKNREGSFLLRGKDLQDAEFQLAANTSKEPHPTDLQRDYVFQSRKAADRARRITTGIYAAGSVALALLAVFGFVMAGRATMNAREAERQAQAALTAQANAEQEQAKAEAAQKVAETESRIANTGRLALESKGALSEFPQRALLLALEAVRINEDAGEPVRSDAEEALRLAIRRVSGRGLPGFRFEVGLLQFTKDNQWLVAGANAGDGEVKIWNFDKLLADAAYQPFSINFPVVGNYDGTWDPKLSLSPQSVWLVMDGAKQTQLWQISVEDDNRQPLTFEGKIEFPNPKDDFDILEKQPEKTILWRIDPQTQNKTENAVFEGSFAALSADRKYLVTDAPQKGLLLWNLSSPKSPPSLLNATHAADYNLILIDPNNRWLLLFRDAPREQFQIPKYDETGNQSGAEAWIATDITLIPLKKTAAPQEYLAPLNMKMDTAYRKPAFSPDGNALVFNGYSKPDAFGSTWENYGILKFDGLAYSYFITDKKNQYIQYLSFVNKDWLYVKLSDNNIGKEVNALLDLRQENIFDGVNLPAALLMDDNGNPRFAEDGDSLLLEDGKRLNFSLLDLNRAIVINAAPAAQASSAGQNELLLALTNNPQAVGLEDSVSKIAESPDGQWLAAGSRDGSLRLWNKANPWNASNTRLQKGGNYIALSADNRWLASGGVLVRLENGVPAAAHLLEETNAPALAVFSPDSRWLAYIQDMSVYKEDAPYKPHVEVKLLDLETLRDGKKPTAATIGKSSIMFSEIRFSADSRWLMVKEEQYFSYEAAGNSLLYDLQAQKSLSLPPSIISFAFTEDQKHALLIGSAVDADGNFNLKKPELWKLPAASGGKLEKIGEIEANDYFLISPNGRWLLSIPGYAGGYLTAMPGKLWNINCITEERSCAPFDIPARDAAFSPNSQYFIAGYKESEDYALPLRFDVWNLANADAPQKIYSGKNKLDLLTFGKTGNLFLLGISNMNNANTAGTFTAWGGYDRIGLNITNFDGFGKMTLSVGSGSEYVSGSFQKDYKVEAFHLKNLGKNAAKPLSLRGHESNISMSHISPDEKFVLTFSGGVRDNGGAPEGLLRLWNVENLLRDPAAKPVILPLAVSNERYISSLAFSPDSRWVYVIDAAYALNYFPTSLERLKEQACAAVGRNFIINEWERFFPEKEYRKTCENLPKHPSAASQ